MFVREPKNGDIQVKCTYQSQNIIQYDKNILFFLSKLWIKGFAKLISFSLLRKYDRKKWIWPLMEAESLSFRF